MYYLLYMKANIQITLKITMNCIKITTEILILISVSGLIDVISKQHDTSLLEHISSSFGKAAKGTDLLTAFVLGYFL